jgi:hypothetical protein
MSIMNASICGSALWALYADAILRKHTLGGSRRLQSGFCALESAYVELQSKAIIVLDLPCFILIRLAHWQLLLFCGVTAVQYARTQEQEYQSRSLLNSVRSQQ